MEFVISIIVPSLSGNWKNFEKVKNAAGIEVIFVTPKLVCFPADNFRCVVETEKGIYNAMNQGAKEANGRFLLFCGDDDTPLIDVDIIRYLSHVADDLDYCVAIPQKGGINYNFELPSLRRFCRRSINHQAVIYSREKFIRYDSNVGFAADYGQLVAYYLQNRKWTVLPFAIVNYGLSGTTSSKSIKPAIARSRLKAIWSVKSGSKFVRSLLILCSIFQVAYWTLKV